ncbi:uncharacterized protein METZ01_LOCUS243925, partial [marine metagenome]
MSSTDRQSPQDHYRDQRDYVKAQELLGQSEYVASADASGVGLVDDEMIVVGMRSVRYATEAHAISDLVDNSIESGASQVHIACHFDGKGNVSEVATLDDGSGMETGFLPHSVRWGATSRKGQRNVFGRFGHGLSSASVNRGQRFAVYSRTDPGDVFHMTSLDLNDLPRDEETGAVRRPGCVEQALPVWVVDYAQKHVSGGVGAVMTVVVWSDLDRMKWHKEKALAHGFMQHLGICYGGWLGTVKIVVQGEAVDPVDPLFITPSHRYFDLEGFPKAIPFFSVEVPIADLDGEKHMVKVRISHIPVDAYDAQAKEGL